MQLLVKLNRAEVVAQYNEFGVIALLQVSLIDRLKQEEPKFRDQVYDTIDALFGFSEGIITRQHTIDKLVTTTGVEITDAEHIEHIIKVDAHIIDYGIMTIQICEDIY